MVRRVLWALLVGALVVGGLSPASASPAPTIAASSTSVLPGEEFTISGSLVSDIPEPVELQRQEGSSWVTVAQDETADRFEFQTSTTTRATYRVVRDEPSFVATATITVSASQSLVLNAPATGRVGYPIKISGYSTPVRSDRYVALQVRTGGDVFETYDEQTPDARGRVAYTLTPDVDADLDVRLVAEDYNGAPSQTTAPTSIDIETAQPVIIALSKTRGPASGGQRIGLTGTDLADATLTFDGTRADIIRQSATAIIATTPAHDTGRVDVAVTTRFGTSDPVDYTYSRPAVTTLDVTRGPIAGGQKVTITGSDLDGPARVLFDGKSAKITAQSADSVTVTTPSHAPGTVDVVVVTSNGTSTPPATYTYARPVVTALSRPSGHVTGGQTVVLTGTDLGQAGKVTFGGDEAEIVENTSTSITVKTPAHRPGGKVRVIVTSPLGYSAYVTFFYSGPVITSVDPLSGGADGGESVTIKGRELGSTVSVSFGGTIARVSQQSDTTLVVDTPAHDPGTVDLVVDTIMGGTLPPVRYTFRRPSISSISPASGPTGGSQVTIDGDYLADTNEVTFDGTVVPVDTRSEKSLVLTAPAHAAGTVQVRVRSSYGTATGSYQYVGAARVVRMNATHGPTAGGTGVPLFGSDLSSATRITVGGEQVTFHYNKIFNTDVLYFTTAAHAAGPVDVVVTFNDGSTYTGTFTFIDQLTGISPDHGPSRDIDVPSPVVTISVVDSADILSIQFDDQYATIYERTATSITVIPPRHAIGSVKVTGITRENNGTTTNALTYRYGEYNAYERA